MPNSTRPSGSRRLVSSSYGANCPHVLPSAAAVLAGTAVETDGTECRKLFLHGSFTTYRAGDVFIAVVEMAGKFAFVATLLADIFVNRHFNSFY